MSHARGLALLLGLLAMSVEPAAGQVGAIDWLCRDGPDCRATFTVRLATAPFPYDGIAVDTGEPFWDSYEEETGQRLHTTQDGVAYAENPHYLDDRVLVHLPPGFDAAQPFRVVVFFHGHLADLVATVIDDYGVPEQVNRSGANLVLVAPALAHDAIDSSIGRLGDPGGLARLLGDVASVLEAQTGVPAARVATAPVVLTAFSGGYRAVAFGLERGGLGERLDGILLLDAIYDHEDMLARHLRQHWRQGFFVALYTGRSERRTERLMTQLALARVPYGGVTPAVLVDGTVAFPLIEADHFEIMRHGPPPWPLADLLARLAPPG
ncbi:MAG: hypothetical protein RLO50_06375 [Azospirillaceae bacterium]